MKLPLSPAFIKKTVKTLAILHGGHRGNGITHSSRYPQANA